MLGVMNNPTDSQVEFYSAARPSSLYAQCRKSSDVRSYWEDGRVMINGEPASPISAEELWRSVIIKGLATSMIKSYEKPKEGPLDIIRRLSSKFSLSRPKSRKSKATKRSNKSQKSYKEDIEQALKEANEEQEKHVTIIRIDTIRKDSHPPTVHFSDDVNSPKVIVPNDGILARLMEEEESTRLHVDRPKTWNVDSGKGSLDESETNNSRAVVHIEHF
ncbi:unnamed protein product [Caenorhabditis auriculariae]|uniref:Uncharacterized protein n=1 Tax=Caenorhabditis auriculariae TaxID=2777116 RepID=A0A8S1HGY5_9PELO|nr:unnamed protein product [Caenorhabditis auriculariae]